MFTSRRITTMGGDKFRDDFSLAFDGTDDYINVDGLSSVFSTDIAYTIQCWFKCTETGLAGGDDEHKSIIFSANDVSDSYANIFRIGVNINNDASPIGGILVVDNQDNNTVHTDSSDKDTGTKYFNDGKWHHLAVTIAGGASDTAIKVFINGSELTNYYTSDAGSADSNVIDTQFDLADKFSIGQEYDSSAATSDFFAGNISELTIYSADLSTSQVRALYNGREPYNHKEGVANTYLQAWYRMGDGLENHSGTTIYDMSDNSNNGTMTNMAADDFQGDAP